MSRSQTPQRKSGIPSCDHCRGRKVRCLPLSDADTPSLTSYPYAFTPTKDSDKPCKACVNRKEECTFGYHYKKPGRPKGIGRGRQESSRATSSSSPIRSHRHSPLVSPAIPRKETTIPSVNFDTDTSTDFFNPFDFGQPTTGTSSFSGSHLNGIGSSFGQSGVEGMSNLCNMDQGTISDSANAGSSAVIGTTQGNQNAFGSSLDNAGNTVGDELRTLHQATIPLDPSFDSLFGLSPTNTSHGIDALQLFSSDVHQTAAPLATFSTPSDASIIGVQDARSAYQSIRQDGPIQSQATGAGINFNGLPDAQWSNHSLSSKPAQIEDIAPWGDVSFLISLFVQYQHALVPLCHRPSFATDILVRRDQKDEPFRGFVMSMAAYTICQCPMKILLERMTRDNLETLLRRLQRASRIIQIRHQMKPSLLVLASTILDWITGQSTTSVEQSDNLLSDVRRLTYALGIHRAEPKEGMSRIEKELCRRIFWEAYVIDKTHALDGHSILMHDADGLPPLPAEVDDERFSTLLNDVSPANSSQPLSYMVGFVMISRLFRWIYQCLWRQRCFHGDPSMGFEVADLVQWALDTKQELDRAMADLPNQLRPGNLGAHQGSSMYGMQAANICITALCLELALIDLRTAASPGENTFGERVETAQRVHRQLEEIPIQCLALNGESMRGKVLRVVLSLLNVADRSTTLGGQIWEWWNMYSRVQFLQIIPVQAPIIVPTRPHSPS